MRLTIELTDVEPPRTNTATAHCVGFDADGRVLLARHVTREWTIPGGHLEPEESAEDALGREAFEEAAATLGAVRLFATERGDLLEGEPNPKYAQPSYQLFYVCRVTGLAPLAANDECLESRLFPVEEALTLPGWLDHNQDLFEAALDAAERFL
jgi:ADP-ribose pyrophosphatase YjhB (NUDIX family)